MNFDGGAQNIVKNITTNSSYPNAVIILGGKKPKNMPNVFHFFSDFLMTIKIICSSKILHFHLFPCLYLAKLIPFKKKIFTEHNTYNRRRNYSFLKILERFIYNEFDYLISISSAVEKSLSVWLNNKNISFVKIYNGINFKNFKYNKFKLINLRKKVIEKKIIKICMVGSFTKQKNQAKLIKMLAKLPSNYQLLLIGDGPEIHSNIFLSKKLNVYNRVKFLGKIENISSIYYKADIYIHSAHWEGFGLTILEAAACGLPIIASNVQGLNEILPKEYLFENSISTNNLADRVLNIHDFDDSEYLSFLISLQKIYSVENMVKQYDFIYSLYI